MRITLFQWTTLVLQNRSQISSVLSSHHQEPKKLQKPPLKRNLLKFRPGKRGSQASQEHQERIQETSHLRLRNNTLRRARKTGLKQAHGHELRDLTSQIKRVRVRLRK